MRPWWKADSSGQVVMSIKFGAKPIEFEKGKAGIAVDCWPTAALLTQLRATAAR